MNLQEGKKPRILSVLMLLKHEHIDIYEAIECIEQITNEEDD